MNLSAQLPIVLLSISVLLAVLVIARAWRFRARPAVKAFLCLMASLVWWLLCSTVEYSGTSLGQHVFWMKAAYPGLATLPVFWLVFTLHYTERGKWWRRRGLPLLFIMPAVTLTIVGTNLHYLMWASVQLDTGHTPALEIVVHGTWFWIHAVYSYTLLLIGSVNLFKLHFKSSGLYRRQVGIMLLASFIPWVANALYIAGVGSTFGIDPTPMAFVVTSLAFLWGLSHVHLLKIMPVAYEAIFKSIDDGAIVIDEQNRIREVNPAAVKIFGKNKAELLDRKLCQVLSPYAYSREKIPDSHLSETVLSLVQHQMQRIYKMHISPISDGKHVSGRLVLLNDDTERRNAEKESKEKALLETELKARTEMQQALADTSHRLQNLMEESPVMICNIDLTGTITYVNKKFEEVTRFLRDDMLGRNGFNLNIFDQGTTQLLKERIQARIASPDAVPIEVRFRRKDGVFIWISTMAEPIRENGVPMGFQIIGQDVTERKQMEEEIRKSEEKYRTIFEAANDVIILMDKRGKIVDVNHQIVKAGGYRREQLIGQDFRVLTKIMPKKSIAIIAKNYMLRMMGVDVPPYEVEMYREDGKVLNIEIHGVSVRDGEKVIGTLSTLRDVTENHKAEAALRYQRELIDQIIANIPNAVLVIDEDRRVLLANNTFYKGFYLSKHKVENKPLGEVIRIAELERGVAETIKSRKKSLSVEFRCGLPDGQHIFAAGLLKMQNQRYLIFMNDITEEREKQERLYLTDRLASVGEMASGVAHELNNPLTSIIGLSSLLAGQEAPAEMKEDLVAINSEAQRCASIVRNLLTFARKHAPKREPLQITRVLEDVLKLRAYEHRAQGITVETSFPADFPEVLADYFQMQQVFLNIILNAESAMVDTNGQGTLKVKGERVNGHVDISFTDDGPGIAKENLRFIFNPFFTTKEVGKGTGLGLSICYGIVSSHGGKIYAKEPSEKGATFVIELPVMDN